MSLRSFQTHPPYRACCWAVLSAFVLATVGPQTSSRASVLDPSKHSCACGMGCEGVCCCASEHGGKKAGESRPETPGSATFQAKSATPPTPSGPCVASFPCDRPDAPAASPGFPGKLLAWRSPGSVFGRNLIERMTMPASGGAPLRAPATPERPPRLRLDRSER